jgi:hypothetical protein
MSSPFLGGMKGFALELGFARTWVVRAVRTTGDANISHVWERRIMLSPFHIGNKAKLRLGEWK